LPEDDVVDSLDIKPILEGLIFVSESPVRLETLVEVLSEANRGVILDTIDQMKAEYENSTRGIELVEVAGGYQFRTKPGLAQWISRLKKMKSVRLSQAALETLAIVAYRQPVIRPVIEEVRGVDSGGVLRTLLERDLIKIVGRKDLPGRPIIYGTTKTFLEKFSLNTLSDLPTLQEIQPPPASEEAVTEEARAADLESASAGETPLPDEAKE